MIEIYKDSELIINFDKNPHIDMRYLLPYLSDEEKDNIRKYPFENKEALKVEIIDLNYDETYELEIPENYHWNGADIVTFLWSILKISSTSEEVLIASMLHDYLIENKGLIDYDRKLSSNIFKALLIVAGVPKWKAKLMSYTVDFYQKTVCRKNWRAYV